ncbi:MAG: GntR family transcriptional regulator [Acidobacteriaceae bacterium]|nr:GntR family transcriptional regulator [Acidobacteriaceae bacterium]
MIPFRLTFQPGVPLYEQVVRAAKRAIVSGQMRPGDPFPSVRTLGKELKINQNTAHKVIGELVADGVLDVRVGVGTVVAAPSTSSSADRARLLKSELEQLVVEAKRLGLTLADIQKALDDHWRRLGGAESYSAAVKTGGQRE